MSEMIIPDELIMNKILIARGVKVMIYSDLADLYGVPAKRLNEQVKRNFKRFPEDFMFRLTEQEKQEVVANCDHLKRLRFSPNLPYVFTEHGAVLLSGRMINTESTALVFERELSKFLSRRCQFQSQHQNICKQ